MGPSQAGSSLAQAEGFSARLGAFSIQLEI